MPQIGHRTRNDGRVRHTDTTVRARAAEGGRAGRAGDWSEGRPSTRGRLGIAGVVVALLVFLFGAAAAIQTTRADRARAEAEVARDAAGVFEAFTTAEVQTLQRVLVLAARMARGGPATLPSLPRDAERLPDVAFVTSPDLQVAAGALPGAPTDLASLPALTAAMARSRDATEADVVLSAPIDGPPPKIYAAAPVYRVPEGGLRATPPVGTTERRASIAGWLVARVDPGPVLAAALPAGLLGRVRDGNVSLAGSGAAPTEPDDVVSRPVTVGGRRWTVDAWSAAGLGAGPAGWWWLLAGASGAATVLWTDARHRRRRREAEAAADTALAHVGLVADLAPVVQRSLELGEVLPAVATALAGELGLAGLVFAEAESDNEFRDVFSIGTVEGMTRWQPESSALLPGETLSIALQRGSRAVGMLRIEAGRALAPDDLRCVRIAAELASAAMVTSRLFTQQEEAVERLQELDALKSVFLATASHELRTPLVAITGFSTILRDQWDNLSEEDRRQFVARVANNAQSLSTLIEALLDFSRLERGALHVRLEPLDLGATVEAVIQQLAPTFDTHTVAADLATGAMVMADRFGVERVVTNLVSNAVKYSPAGSTVVVRVERRGERTRLVVADEGPGVPREQRERIFSRFFRGDSDVVVRTRGVGIGLSVVKEFADQMGATIDVSSSASGGAQFELWFPPPGRPETAPVDEEESRAPLS